ncbi:histo-blood group ABO system transferase-like [Eulemur rufifrons]|uniref:histo-blood group ABO system transferase-like n=1 Tax=Eulemur rufifrons TaxID=859984 RepID=UPI00374406F5
MVYLQPDLLLASREDTLVMTPWLAPIVWEGTFNIEILNEQFWLQDATIGLTVFALEKYVEFLKLFLETAEAHFMVGHRMKYYVFTDQPDDVPLIKLREGRQMVITEIQSHAHRMQVISNFSQERFLGEVDYLVCMDVDMKFSDHVGVEILSSLFGTLHPGYYGVKRSDFPYERRPQSQAYIPEDEGDFYYTGALFGGSVPEVHRLTKACHQAIMIDQASDFEAMGNDETYLNKYLLHHKPTKVLSPEYMWDKQLLFLPVVMQKVTRDDLWLLRRITKQSAADDRDIHEVLREGLWQDILNGPPGFLNFHHLELLLMPFRMGEGLSVPLLLLLHHWDEDPLSGVVQENGKKRVDGSSSPRGNAGKPNLQSKE